MDTILNNYQQTFDFVYLYRRIGDVNEDNVIKSYNSFGSSAAIDTVESFYEPYFSSDLEISKDYADQRIAEYEAMIRLYHIYDSLGCIQDGGEVNELAGTDAPDAAQSEDFVTLGTTIADAKTRAGQYLWQAIRGLKDGCWRISSQLQATLATPQSDDKGDEE